MRALALAACAGLLAVGARGAEPTPPSTPPQAATPAAIGEELRDFGIFGSALYIAAHPDDENTQLITYLARGRGYRTAYLSLTRGDGGQNVIGPEFGDLLGVIRTQELLAARRMDGGRQFFSRARDFGYSKDYRQTLTKWDHQQVLSDIVRVIRTFRPDVVITRFPPEPSTTHGHHTASSALAVEAFKLAGDPKAFPEQLDKLSPWQPRRLVWNSWGPGRFGADDTSPGAIHVAIDGTDPVTGTSFAEFAARSRSMHRTQGFANFSVAAAGSGPRTESFRVLAGDPVSKDFMDGVDTTWARVDGGAEIGRLAQDALRQFKPADPSASVPALIIIKAMLADLGADPVVEEKRRQLDHILQECLGLSVETVISRPDIVPGEQFKLRETAVVRSAVPVTLAAVRTPGTGREIRNRADLRANEPTVRVSKRTLPGATPLSGPYWLREESTPGMFRVDDPSMIGRPESPPAVPVEYVFNVGGQTLVVEDHARYVSADASKGRVLLDPNVIPPVSLSFGSAVALLAPGSSRKVTVEVLSARDGVSGTLRLKAPPEWDVSPRRRRPSGSRRRETKRPSPLRSPPPIPRRPARSPRTPRSRECISEAAALRLATRTFRPSCCSPRRG